MQGGSPAPLRSLVQGLSAVSPRELPPQMLNDPVDHSFCIGEPRRLVLDQLDRHNHRPFTDQCDSVDYVHQQKLPLDLATPPARSRMQP